jgi:enterochelin esterase-like enzyme
LAALRVLSAVHLNFSDRGKRMSRVLLSLIVLGTCNSLSIVSGQERFPSRPPDFSSVSVTDDRKITFRAYAPKAAVVTLTSSDLPSLPQSGLEMNKGSDGVWEATTEVVPAGAYRYSFSIDSITVIDPRNSTTSESNMNTWSLVTVPGSSYSDLKDVPHGTIGTVQYFSKSLNRFRRTHVYTPPGYEKGSDTFPVLYLLHGAFDCDASWTTIGQAGQILDNLLAEGKAKPMIVVMPMGHTGPFVFGPGNNFEKQMQDFETDFQSDLRPLVEDKYRVRSDRKNRAIAGLSMGGAQTLNISFAALGDYSYIGVFSSGVFGMDRGGTESGPGAVWFNKYRETLSNAQLRDGLKLVWFATGKQDFLIGTTKATVKCLQDNGFNVSFEETEGGHTWLNWRDYLHEFAPKLFVD